MASSKVFLCDLCVILVFGFHFLMADEHISPVKTASVENSSIPVGNCSCGGFPTETPGADDSPVVSQMPGLVVKTNEDGEATCKDLCLALATATKAKGPEILCNKLKTAEELKLSAFFKVGERPWKYAGMTAEHPLCCTDSKVKLCASVEVANNVTTTGNKTDAHI